MDVCVWTDDGEWSGSCGYIFHFVDDFCPVGKFPAGNEWKFCPSCGKPIQVDPPEAE